LSKGDFHSGLFAFPFYNQKGKVGGMQESLPDFLQQGIAVITQRGVLCIDQHIVKEAVYGWADIHQKLQ